MDVQDVGVSGILIILVLREVFNFVSRRNGRRNNALTSAEQRTMAEQVRKIDRRSSDLHNWHNKEDNDGVKIWYVRRALEDAVNRLSDSIETQTTVLQTIVQEGRDTRAAVGRLQERMAP